MSKLNNNIIDELNRLIQEERLSKDLQHLRDYYDECKKERDKDDA